MKKLILSTIFVLVVLIGFGQATPSGQFRVATNTTLIGQNMPVGSSLFVVADSSYYVAVAPVASTYSIKTSYTDLVPTNTEKWVLIGSGMSSMPPAGCDTCGFYSAFHIVQEFTENVTGVTGYNHRLVGIPIPNSVLISLNGMELKTSEYSLSSGGGGTIWDGTYGCFYIKLPVYQYDRVKILYAYKIARPASVE